MIYQLLKTTPYLTGQVRLDIVTDQLSGDSKMTADELHVVPLTDSIWTQTDENQLNNRHVDNICNLYNQIHDDFYNCIGDTLLASDIPYYSPDDVIADTYDHTYQMGLRRTSTSKYGKDLSFLLPMWIDNADYIDKLDFYIHVYPVGTTDPEREITSRKVEMSDRMRKYLKEYFTGVSQDLMYIGLRDHTAYITGLDVKQGTVLTKDVSYVNKGITEREHPLLETDDMLNQLFRQTRMIVRQLINFNLCFSIKDLFSSTANNEMKWSQMNLWVEARYNDQKIPLKDIYSNYDNILSYKIDNNPLKEGQYIESWTDSDSVTHKFNVLEYLDDRRCLNLIHLNKRLQPDVHWSLQDNPRYTWNVYNGFSPLVETTDPKTKKTTVKRVEGRFFSTPDMSSPNYDTSKNNIQWMRIIDHTSIETHLISSVSSMMTKGYCSEFKSNEYGTCWVKGIKYNIGNTLEDGINPMTLDEEKITSTGIYANMQVIGPELSNDLKDGRIYAVVIRADNNDYISIVYVTSNDVTKYDGDSKPILDMMTFQNVLSMLNDKLYTDTSVDPKNGKSLIANVYLTKGDFADVFILADTVSGSESDLTPIANRTNAYNLVKLFSRALGTIEYPQVIRFDKTLDITPAPGPIANLITSNNKYDIQYTDEIEYVKRDNSFYSYLMRYDGNMLPQFIDTICEEDLDTETNTVNQFNIGYRLTQWNEMTSDEQTRFNYIVKQRFNPDYPSIGYYYTITDVTDDNPDAKLIVDRPFVSENYTGEINWFRYNKIYYLDPAFTITSDKGVTDDTMEPEKIKALFIEYVCSNGGFDYKTVEQHIWTRYHYTLDWEYTSLDCTDRYDFTVKFELN